MIKILQNQYVNSGQKWTREEEVVLLEELSKDTNIQTIARIHKRSVGAIDSRRREIAYNLYLKNIPMSEIIQKTRLDMACIEQTINRRKPLVIKEVSLENEISGIKKDIKEIKNTLIGIENILANIRFEKS